MVDFTKFTRSKTDQQEGQVSLPFDEEFSIKNPCFPPLWRTSNVFKSTTTESPMTLSQGDNGEREHLFTFIKVTSSFGTHYQDNGNSLRVDPDSGIVLSRYEFDIDILSSDHNELVFVKREVYNEQVTMGSIIKLLLIIIMSIL